MRTNMLLRGTEKTLSLESALAQRRAINVGSNTGDIFAKNIATVSEEQLRAIHSIDGPSGLFRLFELAKTNGSGDFHHFFRLIAEDIDPGQQAAREMLLQFLGTVTDIASQPQELRYDNAKLPQGEDLNRFNSNVLYPSLSEMFYHPGCNPGYLVYGLAGPKILISHPYRGINGQIYNLYANSVDVVTSLTMRGYKGRFLFLDYLPGLNNETDGAKAWVLLFSMMAAHSDVVFFIKGNDGGFSESQKMEIAFTPDRVQKKIIEIPHSELAWAKKPEIGTVDFYFTGKPDSSKEAFEALEAEHAAPLIGLYSRPGFPRNTLLRVDESGNFSSYPLNFPIYGVTP
ncbi:hypothetical protein ABZZ16_01975 [Streptomyces sp. NPDC006386]|uniref:hypothetical protein n=1 Tax=Streptomyces sp. NPDC006386 TaxID=3156762 RepID=UPI0033AEE920